MLDCDSLNRGSMEKKNILKTKSFDFALEIVKQGRNLQEIRREYILSKQLIRSGTSIGANVCEAEQAQSKADFINKLSISLKEACESEYWIELLVRTGYINVEVYEALKSKVVELIRILTASIKTAKKINN